MENTDYQFTPIENLEELSASYFKLDRGWQMQARNGLTREMGIDYWIMQQFMNDNQQYIREGNDLKPTPESLDLAAKICSKHYGRDPIQLRDTWTQVINMEFYDPKYRENIQSKMASLRKL